MPKFYQVNVIPVRVFPAFYVICALEKNPDHHPNYLVSLLCLLGLALLGYLALIDWTISPILLHCVVVAY